jgi:Ni,Fe-hydrogenase III component G
MRFVVWIWKGPRNYRPEHVNYLHRQLQRLGGSKHSLVAVTDETSGFDAGIEVVKTPPAAMALAKLVTPEKPNFPSCYRRLFMFSEDAKELGDVVTLIDVDLVFCRDPISLERPEDFVGWRPLRTWGCENRFGGGIYQLRTGTRTRVWEAFKGPQSIAQARSAGLRGSDQAWISYCLAKTEVCWPQNSGIYSVRDLTHAQKIVRRTSGKHTQTIIRNSKPLDLPPDALIVQFNGPDKSWQTNTQQRHPWLRDIYARSEARQGA